MSYCPTCRTERETDTDRCAVCNAVLVASPQEDEAMDESGELAEVAEFSNVSEAEMIKELLEDNGIQTVQRGEADPIGIVSGAETVSLLVDAKQLSRARELYEAYFAGNETEELPGEE